MKDNMHRSNSHHKRKHYSDDGHESTRRHRKHRSRKDFTEVEVIENSESREEIADVIEIHGSSSEEGEISDSDKSSGEISSRKKHKHSQRHAEKISYREREILATYEDRHIKEPHRRCKKHHKRRHREHNEEKKQRRAESLVSDESSHRRKKEKRSGAEHIAIKQEPKDEERREEIRPRGKVEREEVGEARETSLHRRSRERPMVDVQVKEERPDEAQSDLNPGPSGGIRRRRDEDNTEYDWGSASGAAQGANVKTEPADKDKPNFKLSGKLTEDRNMFNGVVIKYSEPPESRMPKKRWRLYPFKGDQVMPTMYIHRQSAYLIGRDRKVADLPIDHPSCSKQHAALQYRLVSYNKANGLVGKAIRLYIIDLESANGTFVNNKKIEPKKYVELLEKDVIKFGFSSREYVLLHEGSKGDESDDE